MTIILIVIGSDIIVCYGDAFNWKIDIIALEIRLYNYIWILMIISILYKKVKDQEKDDRAFIGCKAI